MANNNVLFDANSGALDSPVFMLDKQVTVIATGMAPDDYITFEVLQLLSGDPAKLCGCRLTPASNAVIELTRPLTCAVCGPEVNSQEVRLTANSTFVILDYPQGALMRAIYHGTGVDDGTAKVWYNASDTPDLNDAMRGCAPLEVWEDTGETRCNIDTGLIETQQSSSCGGIRWVAGDAFEWVNTGLRDCSTAFAEYVLIQQVSPCGDLQWVGMPGDSDGFQFIKWMPTGEYVCEEGSYSRLERNQCGDDVRLAHLDNIVWLPTGNTICGTEGVAIEERNQCGEIRLVDSGPVIFIPTGLQDCEWLPQANPTDYPYYTISIQEVNNCGVLRWGAPSDPIEGFPNGETRCSPGADTFFWRTYSDACNGVTRQLVTIDPADFWVRTGNTSCAQGDIVYLEERSPCGETRWVEDPAGTPSWHDAGGECSYTCDPDTGYLFRVQESSCCGGGERLVQVFVEGEGGLEPAQPEWLSTGTFRCNSYANMVELQERSQCNEYRWTSCSVLAWVATGETRVLNGVSQMQLANPCGEVIWQDIPPESITWTLTGVQACVGGFYQNQETDGFGNVRTVATTEPCGCGDPILTNEYDSGWVLYTGRRDQAGFTTNIFPFVHGLGVIPEFVTMEYRCVNAQGGYTAGNIVVANVHSADQQSGKSTGWSIVISNTNIDLTFDYNNGASLHEWNDTSNFRPNNGDWEFRIRGYA